MIRLEPMDETEYREAMDRAVVRHAADSVRRGEWRDGAALEASRKEMEGSYPQGLRTPGRVFAKVIDGALGTRVGETWYVAHEQGGKVRFWVDWIWIEPEFRRRGLATQVLQELAKVAVEQGADRMGLYTYVDNPGAVALYSKLGFVVQNMAMIKELRQSA